LTPTGNNSDVLQCIPHVVAPSRRVALVAVDIADNVLGHVTQKYLVGLARSQCANTTVSL